MSVKRIISGIQPSGSLTLGNYLGAISLLSDLQKDNELFLFVADLHSLTTGNQDVAKLAQNSLDVIKHYLASGLQPANCHFFVQSQILEHLELSYLLMCNSTFGELSRMTQFKVKANVTQPNKTDSIPTGLLTYPLLMAADILLYQPDEVMIGDDQIQHLELTRDLAVRFNKKYGQTFKLPIPRLNLSASRIMDLQNPSIKMSKSSPHHRGVIFLLDPIEDSLKKIQIALTDSYNSVTVNFEQQPGIYNLLQIYVGLKNSFLINEVHLQRMFTLADAAKEFVHQNYGQFKRGIIDLLKKFLTKYQTNFQQIDNATVEAILQKGTEESRKIARLTLDEVRRKIGLLPFWPGCVS